MICNTRKRFIFAPAAHVLASSFSGTAPYWQHVLFLALWPPPGDSKISGSGSAPLQGAACACPPAAAMSVTR